MAPQHHDLVVIGASAGGVEALRALVVGIPADLRAAVAVVLHMPPNGASALPHILGRVCALPVVSATSGMPVLAGRVHVSPPNHHLLVVDDQFVLSHGPTENGHRPAINALFRSAAVTFGPRVVGVLLSGVLDDGVAGLAAIRARGGEVVVQDPQDALYAGMPRNAIRTLEPEHVLPAAEIGTLLAKLARRSLGPAPPSDAVMTLENEIAHNRRMGVNSHSAEAAGTSGYTCPDCQGALSELRPGEGQFRCRVGHAWTAESLLAAQDDEFERALWTALRSLDEKAGLADRMRRDAMERGRGRLAERYGRIGEEAQEAADVLRRRLTALPRHDVESE